MSSNDSDGAIPTLVHLVVPGDPSKKKTAAVEPEDEAIPTLTQTVRTGNTPQGDDSLDSQIARIVNEVLDQHMQAARAEITHRIKAELLEPQ